MMAAKKKAAKKTGRPSKYRPEHCQLIQTMLSEGACLVEFCAEVGITHQTLHNWRDSNPVFFEALTRAELLGEAYWRKRLRTELMLDNKANAALVKLYFANRFGWSDKNQQEISGPNGAPLGLTVNFVKAQD